MQELVTEIAELRANVALLITLINDLRRNEVNYKHELVAMKQENQQQGEQIKFLEEKNKMMNLASAVEPDSRADMKVKIRDLVREIDGCIAMIKE